MASHHGKVKRRWRAAGIEDDPKTIRRRLSRSVAPASAQNFTAEQASKL